MELSNLLPAVGLLIPYEYKDIQTPQYDKIIASYLQKAHPSASPRFVQIGGIPGAGKSTFCKTSHWDKRLYISFDKIMESIPEYWKDIYRLGSIKTFAKWEMPARIIGYEVLRRAIEKKADIYLEHSGVNDAHVELMKNLHKLGYQTEICFILCDIDEACRRATEREKITHRHTSRDMILQRGALVNRYLETYKPLVDELSIYDTTHNHFALQSQYHQGIKVK